MTLEDCKREELLWIIDFLDDKSENCWLKSAFRELEHRRKEDAKCN